MKMFLILVGAATIGLAGFFLMAKMQSENQIGVIKKIGLAEAANRLIQAADGHLRIVDIRKTNGTPVEAFKVKMYVLEYRAEVEFTKNLWVLIEPISGQTKIVSKKPETIFDYPMYTAIKRQIRAGERESVSGSIVLEKTGKGWRPVPDQEMRRM